VHQFPQVGHDRLRERPCLPEIRAHFRAKVRARVLTCHSVPLLFFQNRSQCITTEGFSSKVPATEKLLPFPQPIGVSYGYGSVGFGAG